MGDVRVKEVSDIEPVDIASVSNIAPVTIDTVRRVENIAPVAVHIKELNQVDPLLVESLRIDQIRGLDPVNVDRLNITRLPVVNLSVNQVPNVDLSVGRLPPVSIGVHQVFDLPSQYMARARLFGFEVLRVQIEGRTRVIPRDCARREQAHAHERSFPDVAAVGNPAIPSTAIERTAHVTRPCPPQPPRPALHAGPPRFRYGAQGPQVRSG